MLFQSSVLNQLSVGERNSDIDSVIILCSFEHLRKLNHIPGTDLDLALKIMWSHQACSWHGGSGSEFSQILVLKSLV